MDPNKGLLCFRQRGIYGKNFKVNWVPGKKIVFVISKVPVRTAYKSYFCDLYKYICFDTLVALFSWPLHGQVPCNLQNTFVHIAIFLRWNLKVRFHGRVYKVLQGPLYLSYIQEANVEEGQCTGEGVYQKQLHDNPSSQTLLAHPRMRLQSSPFAIIYFIILLFFSSEENSQ